MNYIVPSTEPPQDRDLNGLHPIFRSLIERYVEFAQGFLRHELRIGECRRTIDRQVWLYAQGRVEPHLNKPIASRTIDSKHRYGLAVDLIIVDTTTSPQTPIWTPSTWRELYRVAPPSWFGLTPISNEYVHLEIAVAAQLIDRAEELGVERT